MKIPYKGKYVITSPFGTRILNGSTQFHSGIDIVGMEDKTIYAPCNGKIATSTIFYEPLYPGDRTYEWGNYIKLVSENGENVFMCHMSERYVQAGDYVKEGQPIGKEGYTGFVYPKGPGGSHCHFEIRKDGKSIDPMILINATSEQPKENVEEDEEMTGEEIYKKLIEYLSTLPESDWSKKEGHFKDATQKSIMDGKNPRGLITREQLAAVLGRSDLL